MARQKLVDKEISIPKDEAVRQLRTRLTEARAAHHDEVKKALRDLREKLERALSQVKRGEFPTRDVSVYPPSDRRLTEVRAALTACMVSKEASLSFSASAFESLFVRDF